MVACSDSESGQIKVEWLKKEKKCYTLDSNADGSSYISVVDIDAVMFSNVCRNISYTGSRKGPYDMDAETKKEIKKAYEERDKNFEI